MRKSLKYGLLASLSAGISLVTGSAISHDGGDDSGMQVLLEANYMVADAMNTPFASAAGPGRVVEMNIFTGERGITLSSPFNTGNDGSAVCDNGGSNDDDEEGSRSHNRYGGHSRSDTEWHFGCNGGPWKPTGLLFGGEDGHAFITSAAQHGMTEFHRNGTPIRSLHYDYPDQYGNTIPQTEVGPPGPTGTYANAPRPLGTLFLPNGLIAQAVCDANFFNAPDSDRILSGEVDVAGDGNSSNLYFPPVYSTPARSSNSRILIIDPDTLRVVDEITQPGRPGDREHDLWGCMAGMVAGDGGLWVSTFHKAAVFKLDWRHAVRNAGRKNQFDRETGRFRYNNPRNRARVLRIVDMLEDGNPATPPVPADDPMRRDSLRAISLDESGTLYAADRRRSRPCLRGEYPGSPGGCNPGVFRQRVDIVRPGEDWPSRTVALDPGINIIAGIRINRISGPGCEFIRQEVLNEGGVLSGDECDVETLYISASSVNPGCEATGANAANPCFIPGGRVVEYRIDPAHTDDPDTCSGDPADGPVSSGGGNRGCAMPIATLRVINPDTGLEENLDPRMLMAVHEPFSQ